MRIISIVLSFVICFAIAVAQNNDPNGLSQQDSNKIIDSINNYRQKYCVQKLKFDQGRSDQIRDQIKDGKIPQNQQPGTLYYSVRGNYASFTELLANGGDPVTYWTSLSNGHWTCANDICQGDSSLCLPVRQLLVGNGQHVGCSAIKTKDTNSKDNIYIIGCSFDPPVNHDSDKQLLGATGRCDGKCASDKPQNAPPPQPANIDQVIENAKHAVHDKVQADEEVQQVQGELTLAELESGTVRVHDIEEANKKLEKANQDEQKATKEVNDAKEGLKLVDQQVKDENNAAQHQLNDADKQLAQAKALKGPGAQDAVNKAQNVVNQAQDQVKKGQEDNKKLQDKEKDLKQYVAQQKQEEQKQEQQEKQQLQQKIQQIQQQQQQQHPALAVPKTGGPPAGVHVPPPPPVPHPEPYHQEGPVGGKPPQPPKPPGPPPPGTGKIPTPATGGNKPPATGGKPPGPTPTGGKPVGLPLKPPGKTPGNPPKTPATGPGAKKPKEAQPKTSDTKGKGKGNKTPPNTKGAPAPAPAPAPKPSPYSVRFVLKASINTFDKTAQQKFVNGVCSILGIQSSLFTIQSISAGSVVVQGTVQATAAQIANLNNGNLAALGVTSFSAAIANQNKASVATPTTNNSSPTTSTPWYQSTLFIVLVSIGGVLLITIIIVIVIVVRRKRRLQQQKEYMGLAEFGDVTIHDPLMETQYF